MGLFLKKSGNKDQTKAGEMMQILGSCMAQSGQERIVLRTPLARLYQVKRIIFNMYKPVISTRWNSY